MLSEPRLMAPPGLGYSVELNYSMKKIAPVILLLFL